MAKAGTLVKTIILIETEKTTAMLLKKLFKQEGYEVTYLSTHDNALDYLNEFSRNDMSHIVAVVLNYMLDEKRKLTSTSLVPMLTKIKTFNGILLANSSEQFFNNFLIQAGCTHARPGNQKSEAAKHLFEILESQKK